MLASGKFRTLLNFQKFMTLKMLTKSQQVQTETAFRMRGIMSLDIREKKGKK